jgi:hypothetical protein
MALAIDEKCRGPWHAAAYTPHEVAFNALAKLSGCTILFEALHIETKSLRNRSYQLRTERCLIFIKAVMHFPEPVLCASGFSCFGSKLSMRMDLGERKISEYEAEARAKLILEALDDYVCVSAVRALIIGILH